MYRSLFACYIKAVSAIDPSEKFSLSPKSILKIKLFDDLDLFMTRINLPPIVLCQDIMSSTRQHFLYSISSFDNALDYRL